jgi:hypothetical protein
MLAQNTGKAENKRARPENGTGASKQDQHSGAFCHHAEQLSWIHAKNP